MEYHFRPQLKEIWLYFETFVPKFYPSTPKSVQQFGYSFSLGSPTIWNALPDEIHAP